MTTWEDRVRDVCEYLYLGSSLRYLQDCDVNWRVHGGAFVLGNLDSILWTLERHGLWASQDAAEPLRRQRVGLAASAPDHRLTKEEAEALRHNVSRLKAVVREELAGQLTFRVAAGQLSSEHLLCELDAVFQGLLMRLPEDVGRDLEEAGRALALDCPTSAAFMLLRGVGRMVRHFHRDWTGTDRGPPGYFGALVDDLRARPPPPPEDLLRSLDYLKTSFLGLMAAPEREWSRPEVEDLVPLVSAALARMLQVQAEG